MSVRYIGFVIDSCLPSFKACFERRCTPLALLHGWSSGSSIALMRFGWIAHEVNRNPSNKVRYELYRPWRRYAAVVFLKSMSAKCLSLAEKLKSEGVKTIFDLNVDYLTPSSGTFYYEGMKPSALQRRAVLSMIKTCDGVIADSRHLAEIASAHHPYVAWIPDNVCTGLISSTNGWKPDENGRLRLLWSGESVKAFELLRIEQILLELPPTIHLVLITNSLASLSRWYTPYRESFERLLSHISHEVIPFSTVGNLAKEYRKGGVAISPRFLDNPYNLGHTEWKISLAMAQGRMALCSEQMSYLDVAERAKGIGIRVCTEADDWRKAFDEIQRPEFDWASEQNGACRVVAEHYATPVVARDHLRFILGLL